MNMNDFTEEQKDFIYDMMCKAVDDFADLLKDYIEENGTRAIRKVYSSANINIDTVKILSEQVKESINE